MKKTQNLQISDIITEAELVERFGTSKQKESYKNNNGFVGGKQRATLMDEVSRFMKIKPLTNKRYQVTSLLPYEIPKKFPQMNSELYQYVIPVILNKLINGRDEKNKVIFTIGKWARYLDMVNSNYDLVKYNINVAVDNVFTEYSGNEIFDFFMKADGVIDNCIKTSLEYLAKTGAIAWNPILRICYETVDPESTVIDPVTNKYIMGIKTDDHTATDEEREYYYQCMRIADLAADITNSSERYYSYKSRKYNEVLTQELRKKNIKFVYQTYEAFYLNADKCNFLYSLFKIKDIEKTRLKLNLELIKRITANAKTRYKNNPEKYISYRNQSSYVFFYADMCDAVIKYDQESLKDRMMLEDVDTEKFDLKKETIIDGKRV